MPGRGPTKDAHLPEGLGGSRGKFRSERALRVGVLVLLAALFLAGCGGEEDTGLNATEAMNEVEYRVRQSRVQQRSSPLEYAAETFRATAPTGEEAWLVRVHYTGGSTCT